MSCSEQSDRHETILTDSGFLIDTSQSVGSRESPQRVISDIPLVVSDIQPTKEKATSEPLSQELGKRETILKRKQPPNRSNHGVRTVLVQCRGGVNLILGNGKTEEGQFKSSALCLLCSSTCT